MTLPNFILAGFPKCGTTSLYHYLAGHPEIFMSALKEPHYFAAEELTQDSFFDAEVKTLEEYEALFAESGRAKSIGEASTLYPYFEAAGRRIRETLPDVRILMVIRQPAERSHSAFGHLQQSGQATDTTFKHLARQWLRREGDPASIRLRFFEGSRYSQYLPAYQALFPPERLRVILYDDLKADPAGTMREIFAFLEVDENQPLDIDKRHNVTQAPRSRRFEAVFHSSNPIRALGRTILPRPLKEALHRLRRKNWTATRPLHPALRAELTDAYREDILRTEELIGRDLSHWLEPAT